MKRYTTPELEVVLDIPVETVKSIDFLFKQQCDPDADAILLKKYPGDVTCDNGIYNVPFSAAETALFAGGMYFYMDLRITDQTGKVPTTPIVHLYMSNTLFTEKEVVV